MNSTILDRIASLRAGRPLLPDRSNSNPYLVIAQEEGPRRTAYCFSTPVYEEESRRLLDLTLIQDQGRFIYRGAQAQVTLSRTLELKNTRGACSISLPEDPIKVSDREARAGADTLYPTGNGVALRVCCTGSAPRTFRLTAGTSFPDIRVSDTCFSLLEGPTLPFVTLSCVGTLDQTGVVIAPAALSCETVNSRQYDITLLPQSPLGTSVLFELNLYTPKLLQDTPVSARQPLSNNAFGTAAFLGSTQFFGEQRLYLRPDFSLLPEFMGRKIHRVLLHLPKYSRDSAVLQAFSLTRRFCSFGSNWDNQVPAENPVAVSVSDGTAHHLNLTSHLTFPYGRGLRSTEGLMIQAQEKTGVFSALSTGDSYLAPPILEIQYQI